jgi:maltooligosyltrehalose trehalohydrolase
MFGPRVEGDSCLFRLWARPDAKIELVLENSDAPRIIPMSYQPNGMYETRVAGVGSGALYWFKIDGAGPFPDPASRYQPRGVHGPSQVLGASEFSWAGDDFKASPLRNLVIYELHVGTFTPEGTFASAIDKLGSLQELGINAIELMPIAEFAGEHNWGYDGVSLYAPEHSYGAPDDLRRLVLEAHRRGIAVFLDVVYNHLGPDGAYHSTFAPRFYSRKHKTPWGDGLNFDGEGREKVRAYFIESALAWIYNYHVDGLRADAVDTILDDSKPHFLTELTTRVRTAAVELDREVILIAEDARNERKVVLPPEQGGHGFDAVWSDDFHHHMRHRLAGDSDGYYRDFDGTTASIAKTIQDGWYFTGQFTQHWGRPRGTSPEGLSYESRLFCIQNHDQIGNRAFGERLSAQIPRSPYYAAVALLLLAPEIPMLFMGQEWAAQEPFLYFTDHNKELGQLVTEGRRKEFEHFSAFADETRRESIPDPQARETFLRSKLNWDVRNTPEHAACLHWYQRMLQIRKHLLNNAKFKSSRSMSDKVIALEWESSHGKLFAAVALEGPASVSNPTWQQLELFLSSEDELYTHNGQLVSWEPQSGELKFQRAGAVLLAGGDLFMKQGTDPNDR